MARPRKNPDALSLGSAAALAPNLLGWAESLGVALGRGVAQGINSGLSSVNVGSGGSGGGGGTSTALVAGRRRGRPPKVAPGGPIPPERLCKVEGCGREARSKGLCSAHYQAERRRMLAKNA